MIDKAQNKSIGNKNDGITMTAESRINNRYHFAGEGKYQPMSVVASTIEEATAAWKEKRVLREPAQPEAKVVGEQINNE
jgi:hypothetical protein